MNLLIGQYFSSGYFWAIAAAMLQSKVAAIANQATIVLLGLSLANSRAIATSELGLNYRYLCTSNVNHQTHNKPTVFHEHSIDQDHINCKHQYTRLY